MYRSIGLVLLLLVIATATPLTQTRTAVKISRFDFCGRTALPFSQRHGSRRSGSLLHHGAASGGDLARQFFSERIDYLKTAGATDIEMGGFFLCEVDAFTGESTDAQEMNVTPRLRKVVMIFPHVIFLKYLLHYLPPADSSGSLWQKPDQMSVLVHGLAESKFWIGGSP
jgi:hypothetical protein